MADRDDILKLVLGDLSPVEAERVRSEMAGSSDLRAWHAELSRLTGALEAGAARENLFAVPDRLLRTLYEQAPTPGVGWLERLGRIADAVGVLLVDSWRGTDAAAAIRGADGSRRLVVDLDGVSVDLKLEPSLNRYASFDCVGRVEGALVREVFWLELDSGQEHRAGVDEDGFFEVSVGSGRHQFGVESGQGVTLSPVLRHPPTQG